MNKEGLRCSAGLCRRLPLELGMNRFVSLAKNCKRECSPSCKDDFPWDHCCCRSASPQEETFHPPKRTSQHPSKQCVILRQIPQHTVGVVHHPNLFPLVPTGQKPLTCTSSLSISTFLKMVNQNSGMPLGVSSSAVAASFSAITTLFFISPYKTESEHKSH